VSHLCLPGDTADADSCAVIAEIGSLDMKSLERNHILETLAAVNWSRKLAVQKLGISERTLRSKLNQYRSETLN
jgi:two-component system response regulator FlrC